MGVDYEFAPERKSLQHGQMEASSASGISELERHARACIIAREVLGDQVQPQQSNCWRLP
jgi:hypothetical protein